MFGKLKKKLFKHPYDYEIVIFLQNQMLYTDFIEIAKNDKISIKSGFDSFNRVYRIDVLDDAEGDISEFLEDIGKDAIEKHHITLSSYKDEISLPNTAFIIFDEK